MANGATPVPNPGELLAESAHVAIVRCRSGSVHLQIGPVTLTLTPNEFAEVAAVVVCAIERLQQRSASGSARPH